MVDRLIKFIDRASFNGMSFHGTLESGNRRVRALALLWNFSPSSPATVKKHNGKICPAERLNGNFGYQQNPLQTEKFELGYKFDQLIYD
ncbi:MAG: hypothetical protein D3924_16295 [Candidatus Electrothrix sp. AR4]|nr:hypothetical protein [Candidatus Electrothrix sp. AR4]